MTAPAPTPNQRLLEEVRDLHPAFDRLRNDWSVGIRALRRVWRSCVMELARDMPDVLRWSEWDNALVAAHFYGEVGFTGGMGFCVGIPLAVLSIDVRQIGSGRWVPVERVDFTGGEADVAGPAVRLKNGLVQANTYYAEPIQTAKDWAVYDRARIRFVEPVETYLLGSSNQVQPQLQGTGDIVTLVPLPEYYYDAMVYGVAGELAAAAPKGPEAPDANYFRSRAQEARAEAMAQALSQRSHEVWRKRDTMQWGTP